LDFYVPPLRDRWKQTDFTTVAAAITADHVRVALQEIDREGTPASAQSTGYDLIEAGRRYPPKLVFSLAAKYATGQEFDRNLFSGGEDSRAFKVLTKLGFEISSKDLVTPLVSRFIEQAKAGTDLRVSGYLEEYRGLQVRVSFGQGNPARVPWIAFLGKDQSVQKGIYPVLLFFKERNSLLLCYGVSETYPPEDSWDDVPGDTKTVSAWFREKFAREPERYGDSLVRKAYDTAATLPFEDIRSELDEVIGEYEEVLDGGARLPEPEEVREDLPAACKEFGSALRASSIDFGSRHDEIVEAFISALVSKPLVILTGLSGSGKTQIAVRFGEWLGKGKLHVAAVRPDWTGAEALFGYEDGLKPSVEGRSAWAVPAALEFMLTAALDPTNPYLLLLDEMNLAHVERYFADVLSGMESGQPCLPNLVKGADGIWRVRPQGPDRISFPRNLWIVGTVNVDETTYMFSPKVLDRANTFEFRVPSESISSNYRKPVACAPGTRPWCAGCSRSAATIRGTSTTRPPISPRSTKSCGSFIRCSHVSAWSSATASSTRRFASVRSLAKLALVPQRARWIG
jgi:5-methylcytosine-specific restriction protein B